ncbi:MAG: hypothetical protein Q9181_008024 [Wetmoreana brouardii]
MAFTYVDNDLFSSQGRGPREKGAVDGVDNGLSADLATTEKPAVESLDSVLTALNLVKFESYVNDLAVFLIALSADVILQFFDPGFAFLPAMGQ